MDLVQILRDSGVRFAAGVPDSTLREFCWVIAEHPEIDHVTAACEGGALALTLGHWIATGSPGCAYMQNSGLPNALNPIMALAGPDAYDIPFIMIIGWRAAPGIADEPQHRGIGREIVRLLELADIDTLAVEADGSAQVRSFLSGESSTRRRKALLVSPSLTTGGSRRAPARDEADDMDKNTVLQILVDAAGPSEVFVTGIGHTGREMLALRLARGEDPFRDLAAVGGMGFAPQIAAGIAMSDPSRRVFCLDGDGSFLMHAGNHALVSGRKDLKLTHIVLDNGCHASVGGHPTIGPVDFAALGSGLGYPIVRKAKNPSALHDALAAIANTDGAGLIHVPVRTDVPGGLPRPDRSLPAGLAAFRRVAGYDG